MAKGNDGNYLQHSLEVAAAIHLAATHEEGRLYVALAHGMAPFEPCGDLPNGQAGVCLRSALHAARQAPRPADSPIVSAYRATNASLDHYPNTAELLRRMIGEERFSGAITEVDPQKYLQLEEAWSRSGIAPIRSSWRAHAGAEGNLACPGNLDSSWLFTMDPMTYRETGFADDEYLYRADIDRISATVSSFAASGRPGLAALFVYAVKPEVRPRFWAFVDELGKRSETIVESCWLTHQGGNRNLAALLCSDFVFLPEWVPEGLN